MRENRRPFRCRPASAVRRNGEQRPGGLVAHSLALAAVVGLDARTTMLRRERDR